MEAVGSAAWPVVAVASVPPATLARQHHGPPRPPPGSTAPARFTLVLRDHIWDWLYQPIALGVGIAATRLNALQFLTIRRYLTLVFATLILLLTVLALWS